MKKQIRINNTPICQARIRGLNDAMEILSGKWKFYILGTLICGGQLRFMDLLREVEGIGPKMLSKELQDLEMNRIVSRTVLSTKPITVVYELTELGKTLEPVLYAIAHWGIDYRRQMLSGASDQKISDGIE